MAWYFYGMVWYGNVSLCYGMAWYGNVFLWANVEFVPFFKCLRKNV